MHDTALLIGRFQPVHTGHLALLRAALERARQAIVIVGSAHQPRTPKNPFTWQEREAMLRAALPEADRARLTVLPVRDYYDQARWVRAVQAAVAQHAAADARIALVGHFKDASSSYLRDFPGWDLVSLPRQGSIDATPIRNAYLGAYLGGAGLHALAGQMPDSTLQFLHAFAQQPAFATLQDEWHALAAYRASWAGAPYPPMFITVDAVLRCQDHVLLIRRARAPGKGLLALPGGFLEPRDTLWQSCLRELAEETSAALTEDQLRAALRSVQVFDHPDRSQRGRTVTHAHYFDLGDAPLPPVQGGDDAAAAHWVPIAQLRALEDTLFEDHFHILDQLLRLT